MNRGALVRLFRTTVSEIAERDFSHVTEQARIAELGIDSLAMLELVGTLERELGIRLVDEELAGVETVGQLLDLVDSKTS